MKPLSTTFQDTKIITLFITFFVLTACQAPMHKPVLIETNPQGAKVYLNNEYLGETPCTAIFNDVHGPLESYSVVAKMDG